MYLKTFEIKNTIKAKRKSTGHLAARIPIGKNIKTDSFSGK
jgi:hypothetical protein